MVPTFRMLALAASASAVAMTAAAQDRLPQADDSYFRAAADDLQRRLDTRPITGPARRVILFVADGMSIATITAGRIYEGQKRGVDGESNNLAMDTFPYSALVKTYTHDAQVADSAPTAVAMTTGVKTRNDVIGVDQTVPVNDCDAAQGHEVKTIFEMAEEAGLATGVVTTARITHATPAATYGHVPNRDWESDTTMAEAGGTPGGACRDLADQLVNWGYGDGFEIALGGGRANFLPDSVADPEDEGKTGGRADGRNLVEEWTGKSNNHVVVYDKRGLSRVDLDSGAKVLGLFDPSHMEYEADRMRDVGGEPSLAEMTETAIDRLEQSEDGYVLLVEAGRVDHGHHDGNAARALEDMVAFDAAIKKALEMTDREDTLIVVTADHSHTLTINGYPRRGNPLLGVVIDVEDEVAVGLDGKPYTTLGYANGPGGVFPPLPEPVAEETVAEADATLPEAGGSPASPPAAVIEETAAPTAPQAPDAAKMEVVQPEAPAASPAAEAESAASEAAEAEPVARPDLTNVNTEHVDFLQQSLVPLASETHGGDDVAVFAWGPSAHAFQGVVEQNLIYHVMAHAIGLPRDAGSSATGEAPDAN